MMLQQFGKSVLVKLLSGVNMQRTVTIITEDANGNIKSINATSDAFGDGLDYALGYAESAEAQGYYVEIEVSYS